MSSLWQGSMTRHRRTNQRNERTLRDRVSTTTALFLLTSERVHRFWTLGSGSHIDGGIVPCFDSPAMAIVPTHTTSVSIARDFWWLLYAWGNACAHLAPFRPQGEATTSLCFPCVLGNWNEAFAPYPHSQIPSFLKSDPIDM